MMCLENRSSVLFLVTRPSKDKDIFAFKLFAKLDAFCLNICDEKKNIAEIKIQGIKFIVTTTYHVF